MRRCLHAVVLLGLMLSSSCSKQISKEKLKEVDRVAIVVFNVSRFPEMGGMRAYQEGWHHLVNGWPADIHQDALDQFFSTVKTGTRFKWVAPSRVHDDDVYQTFPKPPSTGDLSNSISMRGLERLGPMSSGGYRKLAKSIGADLMFAMTAKVNLQNLGTLGNMTLGESEAIAAVALRVQAYDASGDNVWNEEITAASPAFETDSAGYPKKESYRAAIKEGFKAAAAKVKAKMEGGPAEEEKPARKKKSKRRSDDEE